jgi:hypothetical protein
MKCPGPRGGTRPRCRRRRWPPPRMIIPASEGGHDGLQEGAAVGVAAAVHVVHDVGHAAPCDPVAHRSAVLQMLHQQGELALHIRHQLLAQNADQLVRKQVQADADLLRRGTDSQSAPSCPPHWPSAWRRARDGPVSQACSAVKAVSWSRISPTKITSGAWRMAARRPRESSACRVPLRAG